MDIEHCDCLSLLLRRCESHEQDGETLPFAAMPQTDTASSDPAMAFDLPLNGRAIIRPVFPNRQRSRCRMNSGQIRYPLQTRERIARKCSAANPQPLDQRFVTRFVDSGEVVEELAPLRYELEQSTSGMVILDVSLEMLGETVDALRKDRHLHLRRTGIAGLGRVGLDDFGLAAGR